MLPTIVLKDEAGVALIPIKEAKSKEPKEKLKYPFWCCLGDDDEEEPSADKIEKKYERIGPRQVAFMGGAYTATAGLSLLFFRNRTIVQEFAGASMDMAKKGMLFVPKEYKSLVRCGAYAGIPFLFVISQNLTLPSETANQMLAAIPWIYPTMGCLRADFNALVNLSVPAKKLELDFPKAIEAADAAWKIAASTALLAFAPNGFVKSASAVVFKGESRRIIDLAEEKILPLEGIRRKMAIAALMGTLSLMGAAGVANMGWGPERVFDVLLLTPPIDTLIRTPKARLKGWLKGNKAEKGEASYLKKGAKIAGLAILLSALGAIAAQAAKGNAGFATALLIDLVSIIKIVSKQVSPYAMMTLAGLFLAAAGGVYAADEFAGQEVNQEVYLTMMGIAALMYSTAMYQIRKQIIPPKKPKKPKVVEA